VHQLSVFLLELGKVINKHRKGPKIRIPEPICLQSDSLDMNPGYHYSTLSNCFNFNFRLKTLVIKQITLF